MSKPKRTETRKTEIRKPEQSRSRDWTWLPLVVVLLLAAAIRIRLLQIPLERDEGEFAYMGQLILQGIPPYVQAYNMKFPGIYAAYALIMAVFGQTTAGIRLGLLFVNAATIILVFLLAKRLFDWRAGVVACATYALLSVSPSVLGTAAHATHFVVLPALGGILLLLKAIDTGRTWTIFWSGLLLGLSLLMKQAGAFFVVFAGLYLLWSLLRTRPIAWRRVIGQGALFSLAAIIPFGLSCLVLFLTGAFGKFWFWAITYPREYGSLPLSEGVAVLRRTISRTVGPVVLLWGVAGIGLTALVWEKKARANGVFILGFLLFSVLALSSSFHFRNHYFVLLLPALSLLAGVAVTSAMRMVSEMKLPPVYRFVPLLLFIAVFGYSASRQGEILFKMLPCEASRAIYGANPFPEAVEIAKYIKADTKKHDKIAVLGSEAEIYFYSDRRAATGYIYTYSLMDKQRYARRMQQEMIREIEAARPKYLVFVRIYTSWLGEQDSEQLLIKWYEKYIPEHFDRVGVIDILSQDCTEYRWDEDAIGYTPKSMYFLSVFKRKPS